METVFRSSTIQLKESPKREIPEKTKRPPVVAKTLNIGGIQWGTSPLF
jgi:hypothetical protein